MKKLFLWVATIVLVIALALTGAMTGCKSGAADDTAAAEESKAAETVAAVSADSEVVAASDRTYYYAGAVWAHPYFLDTLLGIEYAKKFYGVEIVRLGPDDFNMQAMSDAIEQSIPKNPAGIFTSLWDTTPIPSVKKAVEAGIPVAVLYTKVPDHGGTVYIGLDNYQCGIDTGRELLKRGGNSGKLGIIMNAGASNTEDKKAGALKALEGSGWEVVVQAEDKADTETAIEAAKAMFNAHPEITGVLGLDSSSGTGIGVAIEELGLEDKEMTIVVHDREDVTLEYIQKGIIDATLEAQTALGPVLAVQLFEEWYKRQETGSDVPVSADNKASNVISMPADCYIKAVIIDQSNVEHFLRANLPKYN